MSLPISEPELNQILALFKSNTKQRTTVKGEPYKLSPISIEGIINRQREKAGIKEKISTNTISQLSPKSKHRSRRETSIRQATSKMSVTQKIMHCLGVGQSEANRIYRYTILPACSGTRNMNASGLSSISQFAAACNSHLYLAFTTENYAEVMGIDPEDTDNIWMVETNYEWKDFISGEITVDDLEFELMQYAQGEYSPIMIDIMVGKA